MKDTKLIILRDVVIVIIIALLLLFASESLIRVFIPQNVSTTYINGMPLGKQDDLLGHRYNPNSAAREKTPEFSVEYRINKDGLRDEALHSDIKQQKSSRILLIGDSFTFGAGVDYDKIWPVIFEKKLLEKGYDVEVIKAGVSGYDTWQEVLYLKELLDKYTPDIVVLVFLPNDLFNNIPIQNAANRKESIDKQDRVIVKADERNQGLHIVTLAKRLLLSNDFLYITIYSITPRYQFFVVPINQTVKEKIAITKDLLLEANSLCEAKKAKFLVLSIPQLFQVIAEKQKYKIDKIDPQLYDKTFAEVAAKEGFIWVPTLEALMNQYGISKKPLYFRFDGHLNNEGSFFIGDYAAGKFITIFREYLKVKS